MGGDITGLITQSRLLISSASGVLIESIALGVPVAIMRIPKKFMYNPIPPNVPGLFGYRVTMQICCSGTWKAS